MNHLSDPGRSRPAGQGIAPLVAAAELVDLLQRLDLNGDTRTLSGVPLSQGYFLGGNRWVRPDRWTGPVRGRARRGSGHCQRQL